MTDTNPQTYEGPRIGEHELSAAEQLKLLHPETAPIPTRAIALLMRAASWPKIGDTVSGQWCAPCGEYRQHVVLDVEPKPNGSLKVRTECQSCGCTGMYRQGM